MVIFVKAKCVQLAGFLLCATIQGQTLPAFTKLTTDPVAQSMGTTACAWGDINNDGHIDLFLAVFTGTGYAYTNNGNGTFTRLTNGPIAAVNAPSFGAAWGDFDNDGLADLLVGMNSGITDLLLRNLGSGNFASVGPAAFPTSGGNANNVAWADYDSDGFVDLFVANSDQNDFLFHNERNGTFRRITANAVALKPGNSQGAAWSDYNDDGRVDLVVTRVNLPTLLYRNDGNGAFLEVTNNIVSQGTSVSQGVAWADYDNDGRVDLFIANPNGRNWLYHNEGDGNFTSILDAPMITGSATHMGCAWADIDNDGWLDLLVVNNGGSNFVCRNNGDGTFSRVLNHLLANDPGTAFSCAWADINNDGFLDVVVTHHRDQPTFLYRNEGNSNAWLKVQLKGHFSNRAAIGARVRIKAVIHGREFWQMREISGGDGLGGQNDPRPCFGLGDAAQANIVRVEWPSGVVQEMYDVAAGQSLPIIEPAARINPPRIEVQAGASASFSLVTELDSEFQVQWRLNGVDLPGETNTTIMVANVDRRHSGVYSALLFTDNGETVFPAPAQLAGPVIFISGPQDLLLKPGSNGVFAVSATGIAPLTYQWRFNDLDLANETNAALMISNAQLASEGRYSVIVSNSFGAFTSTMARLSILIRPTLGQGPLSQSVVAGGNVTLSASASGNPLPLTFRWRKGSSFYASQIVAGTNAFLTLTNVQPIPTNQFTIAVVITNLAGNTTLSPIATITVLADSDYDGMPDEWEDAHNFDAHDPSDAIGDEDQDGLNNRKEYEAGTDPRDAASQLHLTIERPEAARVALWFEAASNRTYRIECADDAHLNWRTLLDVTAAATNGVISATEGHIEKKFYRLLTPRPEQ